MMNNEQQPPPSPDHSGTDVIVCNLQAQPDYNGVGARCLQFHPAKGRYSVRLHFTGKTMLLKPENIRPAAANSVASMNNDQDTSDESERAIRIQFKIQDPKTLTPSEKYYTTNDLEVFKATAGYIRKNPEARRILSLRVKEGLIAKGPGCLVMNLHDVNSAKLRNLDTAEEVLSPEQTVWMSSQEMHEKFGRAWTHGAGEVFGQDKEWPDLVKTSALFAKILSFEQWDESSNDPGDKQFYYKWGMRTRQAQEMIRFHTSRRMVEGETPPMIPENEKERLTMAYFHGRGGYDRFCEIYSRESRDPRLAHIGLNPVHPIGQNSPLWMDHDQMGGYGASMASFFLLSFRSIPYSIEGMQHYEIDKTGWAVVGFENVTLWSPQMDEQIARAENAEEALKMYQRHQETPLSDAALQYEGKSFRKTLPGSQVTKVYKCANPGCDDYGIKQKNQAGGSIGFNLMNKIKCSRCQKEKYCSRDCQKADWKRHKKICSKKKMAK